MEHRPPYPMIPNTASTGPVEPMEFPWCEDCGWSLPFCTCPDKEKFEEEE